jgi:hypothetical protein
MTTSIFKGDTNYPVREIRFNKSMALIPFGAASAVNVLDYFQGTPEIDTNVIKKSLHSSLSYVITNTTVCYLLQILFLSSGDLRNVLLTVSKLSVAYQKLEFHIINDCDIVTARNILIIYIIFSDDFDPANPADLDYLWHLWYSLQWSEDIRKRFLKDVEKMLSDQWTRSNKINIPDIEVLKNILNCWQEMVSADLVPDTAESILQKRCDNNGFFQ